MGKNTINIDGEKLLAIIRARGLDVYEIPKQYGFSKNVIQNAVRAGKASPVVQNLLSSYGIEREDYISYENTEEKRPVDDRLLMSLTVSELEEIIKKAFREALSGATITRG